jgi:hypothetical protein
MPKHKNHAAKQQNRHQKKMDRETQVSATFYYATSGWRCATPSQRLVFVLLCTVAVCSIAQAEATPRTTNSRMIENDEVDSNNPLTYTTNNTTHTNTEKPQSTPLCAASTKVGEHPLIFGCSDSAKAAYKKSSKEYEKDVSSTTKMLSQLAEQAIVYCKLDSILQDPRFHMQFVTENDLPPRVDMLFRAGINSIFMSTPVNDTPDTRRVLQNGIHHAFISRQNLVTRRNFDPELEAGSIVPVATENDYKFWAGAVYQALARIKKIESMLKMSNLARQRLSETDRDLLYQFKKAAKAYQPYNHVSERVNDASLMRLGVLDQNKQLKPGGHTMHKKYKFNDIEMNVPMHTYEVNERSMSIRSVVDPADVHAALYDAIVLIGHTFQGNKGPNLYAEADAYLHEAYEPFPELFNLLFPELQQYHASLTTSEYKACIKQRAN